MFVKHSYKWLALGLFLALLVLLAGGIETTAKLVAGVQAKKAGNEAVELKMTADKDGKAEITIGANKITFRLQANKELDTGLLRISGDEVLIKVFADSQLTDECRIPVKDIPTEYKRFCYDKTPPVVRVSTSPSPNANGWNKDPVTITITAEDEEGGSGIKAIYYKIGTRSPVEVGVSQLTLSQGGRVATYSFKVSDEGTHQLGFWAVDQAGNESQHQALTLRIDTSRPSISVSLSTSSIKQGESISITITASDDLSGIDTVTASDSNLGSISLSRSGDRWGGTIRPSRDGRVTATAYDKAGNSNSDSASYTVIALRPAYFQVTDLSVSPSSPQVGQSVTIRATIKNTGEESGTKTVTLYIDDSRKDSKSLTLGAGRSDTVSFSYTFSYSGTYTVKVSTPDDYKSTTVRVEARPAYFQVSSCSIPSSAKVNESVTFSARITNTGGTSGSQYIRLLIDGSRVDSKYVSLGPGSSETVYFYRSFSYTGTYSVRLESDNDYCSGSITIRAVNQPPRITDVGVSSSISGETVYIDFYIYFTDPDGNVAVLIDECEALSPNTYCEKPYVNYTFEIDIASEAAGITSGTIVFSGKCEAAHTSWRDTFILVDQGGLQSNSWTVDTGGYANCGWSISVH